MLRGDDRCEFRQDKFANRQQIPLSLQHARELREIGFEPVLLLIPQGRVFQIADHLVDVVFHECDLAPRFHLDRACQVSFRNCRRNIGNGAKLRRQIRRQPVHVIGQVAPCASRARHVGLTAQFSLDPDLACHRRNLIGKSGQRLRHAVNCVSKLSDLTFRFDKKLLV